MRNEVIQTTVRRKGAVILHFERELRLQLRRRAVILHLGVRRAVILEN